MELAAFAEGPQVSGVHRDIAHALGYEAGTGGFSTRSLIGCETASATSSSDRILDIQYYSIR